MLIQPKQANLPTRSVADLTALAALSVAGWEGSGICYVQDLRDYFVLGTLVAAVPFEIVTAAGGLYSWVRSGAGSAAWDATVNWSVDAASGDDGDDGATALTALATLEELMRRTYRPESPRATGFNVYVGPGGAGTANTKWVQNVDVEFFGEETGAAPAYAEITAVTSFSRTGAYVPQSVTAAIAWTAGSLLRVRNSVGVSQSRGWMTRTGGAGVGITKLFTAGLAFTDPTIGPPADEIGEFVLPTVRGQFTCLSGSYLGFYSCYVNAEFHACEGTYFDACRMLADFYNCDGMALQECYIDALIVKGTDGASLSACVIKGLVRLWASRMNVSNDTSVVGDIAGTSCGFKVYSGSKLSLYGVGVEFYNSATGVEILESAGAVDCYFTPLGAAPGTGYVYGASNGVVMDISKTNASITYNNKAALVAAATTAEWRHMDGAGTGAQTSGAFAALPSALAIAAAMTGIFPSN